MRDGEPQPNGHYTVHDLTRAWETLTSGRSVLVATHANPDADAVSSVLALAFLLQPLGKHVVARTGDRRLPRNLRFLPGSDALTAPLPDVTRIDVVALVDCADPTRLGPLYQECPGLFDGSIPIVNIDHHVTNTRFGSVNVVDPDAASTTEILAELAFGLSLSPPPLVCTCLLAGLYGDTLGFQTSSTRPEAFLIAARLLEAGADLSAIVTHLFRRKPFSTVRLWGLALARARFDRGIVWTEITPAMLEDSGATADEGEGIVNFLSGTEGAFVAAMFYAQPDGWRVSLRSTSDEVDVARLASAFGGGGHNRAAGCRLPPGDESRRAFIETVARALSELVVASDPAP